MKLTQTRSARTVGLAHGTFNVASGLWPLLHRRSFEAVTGPKQDYWLTSTVALLMVGNGLVQLTVPPTRDGAALARRRPWRWQPWTCERGRGRIRPVYFVHAIAEAGWTWASWRTAR